MINCNLDLNSRFIVSFSKMLNIDQSTLDNIKRDCCPKLTMSKPNHLSNFAVGIVMMKDHIFFQLNP